MSKPRIWMLASLAALAGGCGPTEVEVGQAMLLWGLALAAITMGLERFYVRVLYRNADVRPALPERFVAGVFVSIGALAVAGLARGFEGEHFFIIGVVLAVGYGTNLGLALVLAHASGARWASIVAVAVPLALVIVPGAVLAFFGADTTKAESGLVWLLYPLLWSADYFIGVALLPLAFVAAWAFPRKAPPRFAPARVVRSKG